MAAKLKEIHAELRRRMHATIRGTLEWLQTVVRGYFVYHAIPGNEERLKAFLERLGVLLPAVAIRRPYPTERFDAKHPRQEPCA
jgi:RNA-directed DNA polymerase